MAEEKMVKLIALTPLNHRGRVHDVGEEFTIHEDHAAELIRAKEAAPAGDKAAREAVAELKKKTAAGEEAKEGELSEFQQRQLAKFTEASAAEAIAMIKMEEDEEMLLAMAATEENKAAGSRKSVLEAFKSKGIEA